MSGYKESDIKYEGDNFFVIAINGRHEVCKKGITHATVVGYGSQEGCIRTAKKLEKYPNNVK